jgi:hypothetical protein
VKKPTVKDVMDVQKDISPSRAFTETVPAHPPGGDAGQHRQQSGHTSPALT